MKYLKLFEAFLNNNKESAVKIIVDNIIKRTGIDLHKYDELYSIQKENEFLEGILFISVKKNKAIRINWIKSDIRNIIHSIDLWEDFEFDKNPEWTIGILDDSIIKSIDKIIQFFKNPSGMIQNSIKEEFEPNNRLQDLESKLKRARTEERKIKIKRDIERYKVSISLDERRELESDRIKTDDLEFDVFKSIELYTQQVARKKSNSLIISGMSGIGKTQVVKETLKDLGLVQNEDYYFATGTITTAGLYELLFKYRNSLLVFDDCDAVFKDSDSVNILKGALDTYDVREISKLTKGNTFDPSKMGQDDIDNRYMETGKLPNKFEFSGQVIFISNLNEDKFDSAILSRSLHVDVHLNREQVVSRMRDIMKRINPDLDLSLKEEALEYLIYITENFPVKFDLNIRTLIHSINLRSGNDDEMSFGGKSEKVWKLLIKKYLVKSKNY